MAFIWSFSFTYIKARILTACVEFDSFILHYIFVIEYIEFVVKSQQSSYVIIAGHAWHFYKDLMTDWWLFINNSMDL